MERISKRKMPKFFVNKKQVENETINIIGGDVNHIKNVLRKKEKEKIVICIIGNEEKGIDTISEIEKIEENCIKCRILEYKVSETEGKIQVTIFQGLPKSDKMELVIQKSVELGVYEIYPTEMKRCIVKLKEQEANKKIARWQKISEVAAKQSGRNIIPQIKEKVNIKQVCNLVKDYDKLIVAYEEEKENSLKSELKSIKSKDKENIKIAILVGPEGGIDLEEIEELSKAGAVIVTLGKRILRTETVALNVLSNIMYELEE